MSTDALSWQNPRLARRIPELDGVRGLAILLVLVWHYGANEVTVATGLWQERALATLRLTWSGVDLFFVLSGFLIGGILCDAKNSGSYYRTFYARRIHRIFPLYFTWLAFFAVGLCFVGRGSASPLRALFNPHLPWWSYALFLQNFFMSLSKGWGAQWLAITWSLAVEEQFYLLLPLLVRNLSYRGIAILAVASIVGAPVFRTVLWLSGNVYFGPYTLLPSRTDALGFGVLIALACRNKVAWEWLASRRRHLYWAFLLLGCGVCFLLRYQRYLYTAGLTWIAAFYALLLLLAVVNPGRLESSFFRSQVLMKLGTVAYAVYIFHQGINGLLHFFILGKKPGIYDWPSLFVTVLSLTTVISLAAISWRLMEKPLIRRAHAIYRY